MMFSIVCGFFFKQKAAYEMRISDWSSDVCSSDLAVYSCRERDIARRFVKPWRTRASGMSFQAALNWDHVKRFKDKHDLPLILKGDRKSVGSGKRVSVRVHTGGRRIIKKNTTTP